MVLLKKIFTSGLRVSFGPGRENAAVLHWRRLFFRQRGFVPALGTLSSQLMSLSEIHRLQQFPVPKTELRKKLRRI